MIKPYCWLHYGDPNYCRHFLPGNGQSSYRTFQDFFTRDLARQPQIQGDSVWPCEGYLCESAQVDQTAQTKVKGETRRIETVFGKDKEEISGDYHFSNVFLHNNNYHHIHAPTNGTISRVQHIPGKLLLLRPWAYENRPSLPALTNERINVDITDEQGRCWLLSIVGGPLVATIKLPTWLQVDAAVSIGQKIATFELGSTCCMISPVSPSAQVKDMVEMGLPLTASNAEQPRPEEDMPVSSC